jgi:hypothetical protein
MSLHVLQLAHRQLPHQYWQCTCGQWYHVCRHLDKLRFVGSGLDKAAQTPRRGEGPPKPHTAPHFVVCYFGLHSVPVTGGQLHGFL